MTGSAPADRVTVEFDRGGVAALRLVRGERGNAIDPAWVAAFEAAVERIEAALAGPDPADRPRCLLISADGEAFSVGGDLDHFGGNLDRLAEEMDAMVAPFHAGLGRLAALDLPIVCAVHGAIAGGGLGLAWCSDFVIAAPRARFACGFHRLGLSGDGGSSWFLPRLVGLRRAQQMIIGGRVLSAAEAAEWGLVTEVVEAERLAKHAAALAAELAAGPPIAFARMRSLLRETWSATIEQQLEAERAAIVDCAASADAAEGVAAFVEHRRPDFRGS